MMLRCLGSSSAGNCYLLHNESECLILDAGVSTKEVKKALSYDISKIVSVCVTHKHLDHSKYVSDFLKSGIRVIAPTDFWEENVFEWWFQYGERFDETRGQFKVGNFTICPFECKHNVPCYGFYVRHPDIGCLIYAVDTCYIKYTFRDVQHIMVECNWSKKYVDTEAIKYRHELCDHMEQSVCMDFLKANNSDSLRTVILCHTSDSALDVGEAVDETKKTVNEGILVDFASKGKEWELTNGDICPFM